MRDALAAATGWSLHNGRVIIDVEGEEKFDDSDLLKMFEQASGDAGQW